MGKHELVAFGYICFLINGFEKRKNAKHDKVAINVSVTTITHVYGEKDMRYSIVSELHECPIPTHPPPPPHTIC
jgi:hypothetical protein